MSSIRAISPSSRMIEQMTAASPAPARRHNSIEASAAAGRTLTPPSAVMRGNTCPGETRSPAVVSGATATLMVCARSAAEIPVVTPLAASIERPCGLPDCWSGPGLISSIPRSDARFGVSARQMRPRPWVAMKFIASGVTWRAAIQKSMSPPRSRSPVMIIMRPPASASNAD